MRGRAGRLRRPSADQRVALIQLQRDLFEQNRARIQRHEQAQTPDFAAYEDAYRSDVGDRYRAVAPFGELIREVRASGITLVGDYHTCHLSQRTFHKVARRLRGARTVIALELFATEHQAHLDAWIEGRIGERTLLRRTRLRSRWPYDIWPHFRPIAELARKRGWRLIGLDDHRPPGGTLSDTDRFMAERLVEVLSTACRGTRILTLVGQLHAARPHLPAAIQRCCEARGHQPPRVLTVLQNAEELYWRVADSRRAQDVEVVRVDDDRFCILNTPPMLVQQSYLSWIDSHDDTLDYDRVEERFHQLVAQVARLLGFRRSPAPVRVVAPGDVDGCDALARLDLFERLASDVRAGRSRVLTRHGLVYLGNLSMNRAGETVGRLIHSVESGLDDDQLEGFYAPVLRETIAFFGSKLVNPKRKCRRPPYYRRLLHGVSAVPGADLEELEAASAVLLHMDFERGLRSANVLRIFQLAPASHRRVVRILGKLLGERLYYAFVAQDLSRHEVRSLLAFPLSDPERAAAAYFTLQRQLSRTRLPTRI